MFSWGPQSGEVGAPSRRTLQPIVTGTSVLAVKYKGGVMMAADTLASYGSLARFKDIQRMHKVGDYSLVGASGELSDFQAIKDKLNKLDQNDKNCDDGFSLSPLEICSYMRAVMYQRRNKGNPLWNTLLIAGWKDGEGFLGTVDMIGTTYQDNVLATGFGNYLAIPIMRDRWHPEMTEGEARALLEDCLKVLFYRDCRALNKVQIAKATAEGVVIGEPFVLDTNWSLAGFVTPKAGADTDGSW